MFLFKEAKLESTSRASLISQIEDDTVKNELFFKEVQAWRNIEQKYISKITQLSNTLKDKSHRLLRREMGKMMEEMEIKDCSKLEEHMPFCASLQFSKMLQLLIDGHKSFLSKISFDIFMVDFQNAGKMLLLSKKLLEEEKQLQKEIMSKREQIEKIIQKKEKLRHQKEEEEMVQIFMSDSFESTLDQKIRKKGKIKEIEKQIQEYELKVNEVVEEYQVLTNKETETFKKLKHNSQDLLQCKEETLLKIKLHLGTYWKNLIRQLQNANPFELHTCQCYHINIHQQLENHEDSLVKKLLTQQPGFVQNSLKRIQENLLDELIDYSRDREVKNKIKRMMESKEVNPAETDETCRQVKLISKILSQETIMSEWMNIFKGIINKSSKHRMNFVFVMQFFRLNNQFEMSEAQIYPLYCLITEFLEVCYQCRDSFSLKSMMILLMTYYVSHVGTNGEIIKLYIINFFKKNPLWKDIEFWESVLLECIYIQKKNTINAMIVGSSGNLHKKKEMLEGERAAILNQMLIVVRNMIIFEYTEKQVKSFASRFIKLLKQDDKFQKDVNNTIEEASKEEAKLLTEQKEDVKQFYKQKFDVNKPQAYTIPIDVRRSYIA